MSHPECCCCDCREGAAVGYSFEFKCFAKSKNGRLLPPERRTDLPWDDPRSHVQPPKWCPRKEKCDE